jgi:hypothetical protein
MDGVTVSPDDELAELLGVLDSRSPAPCAS